MFIEGLREDWFANCVKPSLNKDITYLLLLTFYTGSGRLNLRIFVQDLVVLLVAMTYKWVRKLACGRN